MGLKGNINNEIFSSSFKDFTSRKDHFRVFWNWPKQKVINEEVQDISRSKFIHSFIAAETSGVYDTLIDVHASGIR